MNIFRFKELLESKLGNVKPLLMEVTSSEQSQEKTSINNLFSKFVNLIKSDNKIKNWSLNIFKKENPSQKEFNTNDTTSCYRSNIRINTNKSN